MEKADDAVLAFIAGIAHMSLRPPEGENAPAWQAKRLREIRNAANHILHNIADGLIVYVGSDGVSLTKGSRLGLKFKARKDRT